MPTVNVQELPKNALKLTVTVGAEEMKPHLDEAAQRISKQSAIPGFRPGKAGYDIVKQRVGEMKIYEEALEPIVRKTFVEAILGNSIETVGSPKFDVEKLAPGNDLVYTAEVARMPRVTALADFRKISVKAKKPEVTDRDVELTLKDLQRMQTKEVREATGAAAGPADKAVVSMHMKKGGVAVEGGSAEHHVIYLAEDYYIPGLKEKIIGMKEGGSASFTLPFPKDHVQKMLAGSDVDFDITLKELYRLEPPRLDDAFAVSLGQKDLAAMKELVRTNIRQEREAEERAREEREIISAIAKQSRFEDIPDLLLNEEINKMVHELKHGVEEQGAEFDGYLASLKKTLADLKIDFTPQAIMRIKAALIIREVAKQEKIEVPPAEVDAEIDRLAERLEDKEAKKQVYAPAYREYAETMMRNRKVVELLRSAMIK